MSGERSGISWANLESSSGFHFEDEDSGKRSSFQLRDNSVSFLPRAFCSHREESFNNHLLFNLENTVNFTDIYDPDLNHPTILQNHSLTNSQENLDRFSENQTWAGDSIVIKKGLKYLAHFLLHILKKKKVNSYKEVVEEIVKQLISNSQISEDTQNISKEKNNIKRRIYDSLNVMISVGLLERGFKSIKIKNCLTTERNYTIVNRKLDLKDKITEISETIDIKKELVQNLKSKIEALKRFYQKNVKSKSKKRYQMHFPLVFALISENESMELVRREGSLRMLSKDMMIFSETDIIENINLLKNSSEQSEEMISELLFEKNIFVT